MEAHTHTCAREDRRLSIVLPKVKICGKLAASKARAIGLEDSQYDDIVLRPCI
jgi:hypothetical protein